MVECASIAGMVIVFCFFADDEELFLLGPYLSEFLGQHGLRVYEVRTKEGYGARWYINRIVADAAENRDPADAIPTSMTVVSSPGAENQKKIQVQTLGAAIVISDTHTLEFRGFLEPPMENGHELGWRH